MRLPPPLLMVLVGLLMALLAAFSPSLAWPLALRVALGVLLALLGLALALAGLLHFRRVRTTFDPLHPERASRLVSWGIYRFTRNPMYLGMLCLLFGWALYLAAPLAWPGPLVFVWLMNRWQIAAEERALQQLFGEDFLRYQARVRRWL